MIDPRYVTDWAALIDALRRQGMTFPQITRCTGIARTTLDRFRNGATPKHPDGESLVALWCAFTLSERTQVPLTMRILNGNARK